MGERFKIGDIVEKFTGDYKLPGEIRGVFTLWNGGPIRYVARHEAVGGGFFCHIYSEANLRHVPKREDVMDELRYLIRMGKPLWSAVPPGKDQRLDGYAKKGWIVWSENEGWAPTADGRAAAKATK